MEDIVCQHITKTPGVCGGRACIAGHRIRVMDVVVWHEMRGMCPEEIVYHFPGITLADVHAALAYYFDHRAEIEADFRNDEEWAKFAEANYPSLIKEKLGGRANPLLP
ncbi:MAG TPA: DUF433 domain-containing protein [Gemmataceae bacterium]|jgi:uncharacterized protein (DUF433 family)